MATENSPLHDLEHLTGALDFDALRMALATVVRTQIAVIDTILNSGLDTLAPRLRLLLELKDALDTLVPALEDE